MTDDTTTLPPLEFDSHRARALWESFEAQGPIAPGTEGLWKVWGATPAHVRAHDLIVIREPERHLVCYVEDTFTARAAPLRYGFVSDGVEWTLGAGVEIALLRWGTGNTLAEEAP